MEVPIPTFLRRQLRFARRLAPKVEHPQFDWWLEKIDQLESQSPVEEQTPMLAAAEPRAAYESKQPGQT